MKYNAEVTVTYRFEVEADDAYNAEREASLQYQDNPYRAEIDTIYVRESDDEYLDIDDDDIEVGEGG